MSGGFLAKLLGSLDNSSKPAVQATPIVAETLTPATVVEEFEFGRVFATADDMLRAFEALEDSYVPNAGSGARNHVGPAIKKRDPGNPLVGMDYKSVALQWKAQEGNSTKSIKQSVIEALADKLGTVDLTDEQRSKFNKATLKYVEKITPPEEEALPETEPAVEDDSDEKLAMFVEGKYVGSVPDGGKAIHFVDDTSETAFQKFYLMPNGDLYSVSKDGVAEIDSDFWKSAIQTAMDAGDWVEESDLPPTMDREVDISTEEETPAEETPETVEVHSLESPEPIRVDAAAPSVDPPSVEEKPLESAVLVIDGKEVGKVSNIVFNQETGVTYSYNHTGTSGPTITIVTGTKEADSPKEELPTGG